MLFFENFKSGNYKLLALIMRETCFVNVYNEIVIAKEEKAK